MQNIHPVTLVVLLCLPPLHLLLVVERDDFANPHVRNCSQKLCVKKIMEECAWKTWWVGQSFLHGNCSRSLGPTLESQVASRKSGRELAAGTGTGTRTGTSYQRLYSIELNNYAFSTMRIYKVGNFSLNCWGKFNKNIFTNYSNHKIHS